MAGTFNQRIAEMGPYDFWASAYSLGLSTEDADAISAGTALPDQIDRMVKAATAAKTALIEAAYNEPRPS